MSEESEICNKYNIEENQIEINKRDKGGVSQSQFTCKSTNVEECMTFVFFVNFLLSGKSDQ